MKDKNSERQHHGIKEIILRGDYYYYYVGVGDIREEGRSGRDARTVWTGKRKVSGGSGDGGPHQRLSCGTHVCMHFYVIKFHGDTHNR
jgi:hypothetical protein